jgi:hypothetical protein
VSLREGSHLRNLSSCVLGTEGSSGMMTCAFSVIPATSCMVLTEVDSRLYTGASVVKRRTRMRAGEEGLVG